MMNFMLRRKSDFSLIYTTGKIIYSRLFKCFVLEHTESFRCGLVINKKKGKACKRNKCRRQLKNIIHPFLKRYRVNIDIIFVPASIKNIPFNVLKADVEEILFKYANC